MKTNYEGRQRKELAAAIAEIIGEKAVYMKAPTYAYQIGRFTVDRNGDLTCDDEASLEGLLPGLAEKGFTADEKPQEDATDADGSGLTVTVPVTAASVDNLKNLLEAKGALIKKALGITDISIKVKDDKISFPWFPEMPEPDEVKSLHRVHCRHLPDEQGAETHQLDRAAYRQREVHISGFPDPA
jgi:hypothetical protein